MEQEKTELKSSSSSSMFNYRRRPEAVIRRTDTKASKMPMTIRIPYYFQCLKDTTVDYWIPAGIPLSFWAHRIMVSQAFPEGYIGMFGLGPLLPP